MSNHGGLLSCSLFRHSHRVMLACQPDGGRARAFILRLFREDHLVADVEMLEGRVEHAVSVKVNLAVIWRLDEAVAFLRKAC